jgi:hypothetical protein
MSENTQRVFVHVGVPKSGTTFLQSSLARNRAELRERGILYPAGDRDLMFRAALDVRGNHRAWGRRASDVEGAWDDVCAQAHAHPGTTVISHELLAAAEPEVVARALGGLDGLEVHVVATARDLARQVTAEWQEGVKHGRSLSFAEFTRRVLDAGADNAHARRFTASQDLPEVLHRWGDALPAERVHLVTCPEPGGDPAELWRLLGEVAGFDAAVLEPAGDGRANSSLGVVEVDLLRRVNAALDRRLVQPDYGRLVKQWFVADLLTPRSSPRPQLPRELYDDLAVVGERWVKEVDRAGWAVHGDVRRLVPVAPTEPAPHPDEVDRDAEVAKAAAVVAEMLLELQRTRRRVDELVEERKTLKKKRKSLKKKLAALRDGNAE